VGECLIDTNASRSYVYLAAKALDDLTNNCDWSAHKEIAHLPRTGILNWLWQVKFFSSKTVTHVVDKMLHACGGTGYKPALGIERLLRDGKAGWVMGPHQRGAAPVRRQVGSARLRGAGTTGTSR
jgi:alkylation response protein AidB-like acyl-CoA dehydrogenase